MEKDGGAAFGQKGAEGGRIALIPAIIRRGNSLFSYLGFPVTEKMQKGAFYRPGKPGGNIYAHLGRPR